MYALHWLPVSIESDIKSPYNIAIAFTASARPISFVLRRVKCTLDDPTCEFGDAWRSSDHKNTIGRTEFKFVYLHPLEFAPALTVLFPAISWGGGNSLPPNPKFPHPRKTPKIQKNPLKMHRIYPPPPPDICFPSEAGV